MATENKTREERYIREIKSNLEIALLSINNMAIQLGGLTSPKTEIKVVHARTSGYVNWDSTHDSLKTKQWTRLSGYTYYCARKERIQMTLSPPVDVFVLNEMTRFPPNEAYLNVSNPIVAAEILFMLDCSPGPGLFRNFINIAMTDCHTRNSFEEKYGLKWVEPCDHAIENSIGSALGTPVEAEKKLDGPISTSITVNELNIKLTSESHDKPGTPEREDTKETLETDLTGEYNPDPLPVINEPASNSDDITNDSKAVLKQETNTLTCLAEDSNAANGVVIKSVNKEPYSLLNDENPTVILDPELVHTCISVQVSNPVGVLVNDSDRKQIIDTFYFHMSEDTYERKQVMETSNNTEFTNESSPTSTLTINEPANSNEVLEDNKAEVVLQQETDIQTCLAETAKSAKKEPYSLLNIENPTVILDQEHVLTCIPVQVSNPVGVSALVNDSDKKPILMSETPKYIVDLEQVTETDNATNRQEIYAINTSIILDDSTKILSIPNFFSAKDNMYPEKLSKQEQPQNKKMSEQELSTDTSATENDDKIKVLKKQEHFPETCNEISVLEPVPVNVKTTGNILDITLLEQDITDSMKEDLILENNLIQITNDENLEVMSNPEELRETFKNFSDTTPTDENSNENSGLNSLNNDKLSEEDSQELFAKFRDILNHLTILNVDTMVEKIHALEITNEKELKGITDIFFHKLLEDPDYAKLYADLTRKLSTLRVGYNNDRITNNVSFRSCVYKKCQDIFKSRKSYEHVMKGTECAISNDCYKNELEAMGDEESNVVISKAAANIRFIGELYMVKYMPYNLISYLLGVLIKDLDETDLKYACDLLTAIGKQLEYDDWSSMAHIFKKMQDIVDFKTNNVSENVKLMIQNVIELKKRNWLNSNKLFSISLPKTMEDFQKEAEARALNVMFMNACGSRSTGNDGVPDVKIYSIKALKQQYLTQEILEYIKIPPIFFQNVASKKYNILEKIQADSRSDHIDCRREMLAVNQKDVLKWEESYLSRKNTRMFPKTSITEMLPMSRRYTTHVNAMLLLTDGQIRKRVRSAIDEYQSNQCDEELVIEVKQNYLDCHHASVINEIVNIAFEKVGKEFDLIVKSLVVLVATETVTPENFESGLLETFQYAPDLLIDIPLLYSFLAKILVPHIVKGFVTILKLLELSENIILSNQGNMFLKELVIQLNESMGCSSVARIWRESGLLLSQWMPEEDVEEWIFDNGFDFLDESSEPTTHDTNEDLVLTKKTMQ